MDFKKATYLMVVVLGVVLATNCDRLMCGEHQAMTVVSPGGKYSATVFERDCGATTGFVTLVMLYPSRDQPKADREQAVVLYEGKVQAQLKWKTDHELYISASDAELLKVNTKWQDVALFVDMGSAGLSERVK